jgi:hypothetical protein
MNKTDVLTSTVTLAPTELLGNLNIVLASNGGVLSGEVRGVPNATVVLVPEKKGILRVDLYKTVMADHRGEFTISGIAPGRYNAYAFRRIQQGVYFDDAFLQRFAGWAVPVEVQAGLIGRVELRPLD